MSEKRRLQPIEEPVEKAGEITSAGMQSDFGPVSSAVMLTQLGIPRKGKKRRKHFLIDQSVLMKAKSLRLDELIKRLDKGGE